MLKVPVDSFTETLFLFFRLRSIKTEISARQKELEARAKQKAEKKARDLYRTKTLSKNKYPFYVNLEQNISEY